MITRISFILFTLCCFSFLEAQEIKDTEIKVTEGFLPEIPEANKLNEQAIFIDSIKVDKRQKYSVLQYTLDTDFKTRPLKAAKIKSETISKLYPSELFFSFGSQSTTTAVFSYSSKRSKTISYGLHLKHFRNKFQIDNKQAGKSNDALHFYLKKINTKHVLFGVLDYTRDHFSSYGHLVNLNQELPKTRFSYMKLSVSAISQELSKDKFKHHSTFFLSDFNERSENHLQLSSVIDKEFNGVPVSLDLQIDNYLNYNSKQDIANLQKQDFKSFSISPSLDIRKFSIDFNLGFGMDYESDGGFDFFPKVIAEKELVKGILLVSAGIEDNKYRNTYKSLSDQNSFIHSLGTNHIIFKEDTLLDLRTTELKELFFSIKNMLGKDEEWEATIRYGVVENLPYFENNYRTEYNRFLVHYIDALQLHISSSYIREINNIMGLIIKGDFYTWSNLNISHKPKLLLHVRLPINLRDKIILEPALDYIGVQKAFFLTEYTLDPRLNLNLGIRYNYSKTFSAYLQINNMTNSQKEIWRDYKEIGFNGMLGLSYSF